MKRIHSKTASKKNKKHDKKHFSLLEALRLYATMTVGA